MASRPGRPRKSITIVQPNDDDESPQVASAEEETISLGGNQATDNLESYYNEFVENNQNTQMLFVVEKLASNQYRETRAFCFSYPIDKMNFDEMLERTKREFGHGEYRLLAKLRGAIRMNRSFSIAETQITQSDNSSNSAALEKLLESNRDLIERIQNRDDGKKIDLVSVLTVAPPVIAAVVSAVRAFVPKQPNPMNPLEMVSMMKQIQEMTASSSDGGGDSFLSALEKFAPAILQAGAAETSGRIQALEAQNKMLLQKLQSSENNHGTDKTSQTSLNIGQPDPVSIVFDMLNRAAARGGDPVSYANLLFDQLGDDVAIAIVDEFNQPGGLEKLKSMNPAIAQHEIFYQSVFDAMKKMIAED